MSGYYKMILKELFDSTEQRPALVRDVENYIKNLEARLEKQVEAHKLSVQQVCEIKDNTIKEQQTIIENTRKTLERYELENKALRELLRLWI